MRLKSNKLLHISALFLYISLTVVMTWPLALNLTTAIPGDSFDGWQNYWNQWWIKVALVDQIRNPLITDLLYAPTGVGLYFHTLNPFNGITTLPIQLSAGLIPAYNAVVFMSWVLGGYGVYLLVLWVFYRLDIGDWGAGIGDRPQHIQSSLSIHISAFCAGLVFTFSPFHMAHLLGHMQVMSLEWIPFYILYLMRSLDRVREGQMWQRDAFMAGIFLTLVGLCDWYFVLYLFFFTGLTILAFWTTSLINTRHAKTSQQIVISNIQYRISLLLPPLLSGLVFFLLLSPLLIPMLREASQFSFMVRPPNDLYILSASMMDFLIPNRLHTLFRPESFEWMGNQIAPVSERTISIGYTPLILAIIALWRYRQRVGIWLFSTLFFLFMALGPDIHWGNITWQDIPSTDGENVLESSWTPFALLNQAIPFMRISRSVSRYALMVQLSIAVLAGLGLAFLWHRRAWKTTALAIVCPLLILAEYWVAPYPLSPPDTPDFYQQIDEIQGLESSLSQQEAGSILNLPMNYDRPGYLLYQTVHRRPLAVAYISRDDPRTLTERIPVLQHLRHLGPDIIDVDPAAIGLTVLNDLGIDLVVLDRYKMPSGQEREYTIGLATAIFAGQMPIYEDDRLSVYQVVPSERTNSYLILGPLYWGPLEHDEKGLAHRKLQGGAAKLTLRIHQNLSKNSKAELRIRYRTLGEASLLIQQTEEDSEPLASIPVAVDGNEARVDISALLDDDAEQIDLFLLPESSNTIWIEELELVLPSKS